MEMNENNIPENDITEETDVTESTQSYGDIKPEDVPTEEHQYTIKFYSMDGRVYLLDGDNIDWDPLMDDHAIAEMTQNQMTLRQMRKELVFAHHEGDHPAIVDTAFEQVGDYMSKLVGFSTDYKETYPDANDWCIALCMVTDCLELVTIILHEIDVRKLAISTIDNLNLDSMVPNLESMMPMFNPAMFGDEPANADNENTNNNEEEPTE